MKIPVYERRNTIPGPDIRTPHATGAMFGEQVGQATAKLGQTIASTFEKIGNDAKEYQDKADTTTANLALSEAETKASIETIKAENETPPDQIAGYSDRSRDRMNEIGQEALAKIPQSQQQRAQQHWGKFAGHADVRAYKYGQDRSEAHWSSKIDEHVGELAAQVQKAPEDLAGARVRLEEVIAGAPLQEWKKRDMLGAKLPMLVEGAMQGYRDKLKPVKPEDRPIGQARDGIILQMQKLHKAVDDWGVDHDTRSRGSVQDLKGGLSSITTGGGKKVSVATEHAANFKGFIEDYERTGGDVSAIGGQNTRNIAGTNTPSLHSFGRAIDINQGGRNVPTSGKQFHPLGIKHEEALAAKWGLVAGSTWRNPDRGHFEVRNPASAAKALGEVQMADADADADAGGSGDGRVQIAQAGGDVSGIKMGAQKRQQFSNHLRSIIENAVNESKLGDREEAAALTRAVNDDTAQILATGKQSPLNRVRVERSQGPAFADGWQVQRDASTDYYNRMLGLAELHPLEAEQRVESLRPLEGPEFPFRQALHKKGEDQLTALNIARTTDPAAFADSTRAIKEFRLTMKPGNVADMEGLIAARMDTQRTLSVPELSIAPITNEEARTLGLRVIDKLGAIDPKQRAVGLRELAQGLEQTYGAKYAYPVLTYAVQQMGSQNKETAEEITRIIREVQIGEHEPGKLVTERKRASAEAETALKSLQGDFSLPWTAKGGAVLDPPRIDLTGPDGSPMSVKFRDLQWLVTSPANAQPGFDATYGEGAAWAVINNLRTYGSTSAPVEMGEGPAAVKGPSVSRPGGRASFEGQNVPTAPAAPAAPAVPTAAPTTPTTGQRNYAPEDVKRLAADPENQRAQFEQQYGPGSADEALQVFNSRPGRQKKSEAGDILEGLASQMAMFSADSNAKVDQLFQHTTAKREFTYGDDGALTGMRVAGKEYGVERDTNKRITGMTVKET